MGCAVSRQKILADSADSNLSPRLKGQLGSDGDTVKAYIQTVNGISPSAPLAHSDKMRELSISGDVFNFKINYCYISQRGFYPNALGKANQDSYVICESILGDPNSHIFGIFDGHGEFGDSCSHFAANSVPEQLVKVLEMNGGVKALDGPLMESIYSDALVNANKAMHQSKIDDTLSGTTCISVIIRGDTLYVANVGDSRAIIASEMEEGLVYSPLSDDQTPYRKDERERVKAKGARVLTVEQIEGKEPIHENWGCETGDVIDEIGDPPRVWDESLERPGCAFTRSLGDSVAEACGVCGEPEILAWKLSPYNKYVIIASDGVFEFLTSQAVIDIISKFENIVEGAKYVVAEAYRLWLTYDERTDDISLIVIRIDDMKETVGVKKTEVIMRHHSCILETGSNKTTRDSKPVRKAMSQAKRKLVNASWHTDDTDHMDFESLVTFKSAAEIKRISTMIESNFMFQHLSALQKDQIFQVMTMRWVRAGETIIKEGDLGDEMYIIDSGSFMVSKKDESGVSQVVFNYTSSGAAFGELSLMYRQRRAATVRAVSDGALWCLGRHAFRVVLMRPRREGLLKVLKALPVFQNLSFPQLERLCATSHEQTYANKDVVFGASSKPEGGDQKERQWIVCVVRLGSMKLVPENVEVSSRLEYRGESNFFSSIEMGGDKDEQDGNSTDLSSSRIKEEDRDGDGGHDRPRIGLYSSESKRGSSSDLGSVPPKLRVFSSVISQGISTVAYIPTSAFLEIVGQSAEKELLSAVCLRQQQSLAAGGNAHSSMKPRRSIFSMPDRLELTKKVNLRNDLTLHHAVLPIGDFAYLGTFVHETGQTYSVKVIAKFKAAQRRMDMRLLDERIFLSALRGLGSCVPKIVSTFQDSRVALLIYEDVFCCDFTAVLSAGAISKAMKPYYAACIFAGITALHNNGLMHRYVTPDAVYITTKGVPMLSDMRYSKRMDGSKSFTICGDPLYFAPEIIRQQGYDYSVDLWAFGILLFEMYEESGPFGPDDVEETQLFTAVTSHKEGLESFSDKTPRAARDLISLMLHPEAQKRGGYTDIKKVINMPYFEDIVWDRLGHDDGTPVSSDVHCAIRASTVFEESQLEPHSSLLFQQF